MSTQLEDTKVRAELYDITRGLLADGFTVYYLPSGTPALTSWIIFGKSGYGDKINTGTVEYDSLNGFTVSATIKPSREYGSGVALWFDRDEQGPNEFKTMLDACRAAVYPTVRIRYMSGDLPRVPNDGIEHFSWCSDRLVNIVEL